MRAKARTRVCAGPRNGKPGRYAVGEPAGLDVGEKRPLGSWVTATLCVLWFMKS